jgi:flagellar biosynthetic protein FliP
VTFSVFAGVALTLALVLSLVAIALRLLRRVMGGTGGGVIGIARNSATPLQVVQRVALGPRQGIAIVRIGDQRVAVSVGEGGVRTLLELDPEPVPEVAAESAAAPVGNGARDFGALLRRGLRSAGVPFLSLCIALALPGGVDAQARPAPAPASAPTAQAPATNKPSLDQMLGRAAPQLELSVGKNDNGTGGLRLSGTVGVVVMMGLLALLPSLVLLTTSFTRILIVLNFLKQALGTQTAPPAPLVAGLALVLTGFVMAPTMREVNEIALAPWLEGSIEQSEMMKRATGPMRSFMIRQVRESDVATFIDISGGPAPKTIEETPTLVLMSAFVTSELRTAFQLGFVLFLPFIIIDIVVASVLMSMGMFMLPPAMISLPFKLLLFVLVDGWSLVVQGLVASFR